MTMLRGIAWDHSRAYPPLVAASQRYGELHRDVDVRWSKRSLHEFGHADLSTLAREFDLVILDHPFAGEAVANRDLLMLEDRIDKNLLESLSTGTMGPSYESYVFDGRLIALPIDVATQVASFRPDLLERLGKPVPSTWDEVVELARLGRVLIPGFHVDVLLTFLGFCVSLGARTFNDVAVPDDIGRDCLRRMRELAAYLPDETWGYSPIAVYEKMASGDDFAYCPFAYSYQNYSREGFAAHRLQFANLVNLPEGNSLRGVLGGTGIAISSGCKDPKTAIEFATYLAGEQCQRYIYFPAGGQPAAEAVWVDPQANALTANFFQATYRSTQESWVRPRYRGYIHFQENAGVPIVEYLRRKGNELRVIEQINSIYRNSIANTGAKSHV